MTSYGGIPFTGLNVFPIRTLLQVELTFGVKDMQMNYRMQLFATIVTLAASSGTYDITLFIDKGKHFLIVIAVHDVCFKKNGTL